MRENITLLIAVALLAWSGYTEEFRIKVLKEQIAEAINAGPVIDPKQAREIERLDKKVKDASAIGLEFKEELDAARKRIKELERDLEYADNRLDREPDYEEPKATYRPDYSGSNNVDNAAKAKLEADIATLTENLRKGYALRDSIAREQSNFREFGSSSLGRGGQGAGRKGIRTSDSDRERWEANKKARLDNAQKYIDSVQAKLNELRAQR